MDEPISSGSCGYGFEVWSTDPLKAWLGDGLDVGLHEGHDLRITAYDLPWEEDFVDGDAK